MFLTTALKDRLLLVCLQILNTFSHEGKQSGLTIFQSLVGRAIVKAFFKLYALLSALKIALSLKVNVQVLPKVRGPEFCFRFGIPFIFPKFGCQLVSFEAVEKFKLCWL